MSGYEWIPDARSTPLPAEVGARLAAARRAAGLGTRGLAARSTIARNMIQHLEAGRRAPSRVTVELLDGVLGFEPDLLDELLRYAVVNAGRSRKQAERAAGVRRAR